MVKKIISVVLFLLVVMVGYTQKDILLHLIQEKGMTAVSVSIVLVAIDVFFPIVPFTILAALIGGIFGIWHGIGISLSGSMLGTIILFFLTRYGFKDWAQRYLLKYPKIKAYEDVFEKNSFVSILTLRLIPIIPALAMNVACGVSNVKWGVFFIASTIGKIPNIVLLSFAGAHFQENKWLSFGVYGTYITIILILSYQFIYKKNIQLLSQHAKK